MKRIEEYKVQIERAKIANGEAFEEVTKWSLEVENQQASVDKDIV